MLRNNPDTDWERFGAEDPYYSVLNTEAYRRGRLDADGMAEIFGSGEREVANFLSEAERRAGPIGRESALEFGCGVGRLLAPLDKSFERATGVDVSPSMLAEAATHCPGSTLLLSDDDLSLISDEFDFILSYLVFQHIPVRRGEKIIRGLLARLRPGGVAALHITTERSTPAWRHLVHVLRRGFLPLHWLGNIASGMRWNEPMMQTNLYDLDRIRRIASDSGLVDLGGLHVQHHDHIGWMVFLHRPKLT